MSALLASYKAIAVSRILFGVSVDRRQTKSASGSLLVELDHVKNVNRAQQIVLIQCHLQHQRRSSPGAKCSVNTLLGFPGCARRPDSPNARVNARAPRELLLQFP